MEVDGKHYDRALMACRAIRPQDYDEDRLALWNKAIASGLEVPPTYPGAIPEPCEACGIDVQVGPRQQAAMAQLGRDKVEIVCLICAVSDAIYSQALGATYDIHSLNNPYKEGK